MANNNNSMNLRPLVSIEYIRVKEINDDNDETNVRVYGTVIVTDCWGDDIVYHDALGTFDWRECFSLIGPFRAISSDDTFIISVKFWAKYWTGEQLMDKEIARGEIVWDPRTRYLSSYEKPVQEDVPGKHGSVTVGYSVIKQALGVTVKVMMMNMRRAEIYGTVKAERLLGGSSTTWMLYDRQSDEPQHILRVNPNLTLTRPTFAVPVDSDLTITVDLWKYNPKNLSYNCQVAMGSVQFTPKFGTQVQTITGKDNKNYRDVQVYITCE